MNTKLIRWWKLGACRSLAILAGLVLLVGTPRPGFAGTVGRVVSIGGHASDLALDEARGVLYVANYTANRVEVMSLADGSIRTSINVSAQPSSVSLSADGRYLVVAHFGAFQQGANNNGLTVIDLASNSRQTYVLGSAPLGVAFGVDNLALVVTATEFMVFDPVTGMTQVLGTISGVTTKSLPQPVGQYPSNIVAASMAVSGDGLWIFGSAAVGTGTGGSGATSNNTIEFSYEVTTKRVDAAFWIWSPPPGPRAVSVNFDGSMYMSGWSMFDRRRDVNFSQFGNVSGVFDVGTHVYDHARGRIYAQFLDDEGNSGNTQNVRARAPILQVLDADNLAVRERLQLPEHLSGKSIMNADSSVMYAISDSGITIIPIGNLERVPRVVADKENIIVRGNFCDRRVSSQELVLVDPSGANTDFSLSVSSPGVTVSPSTGVTPATVRVNIDPSAYQNQKGTVQVAIEVRSGRGVNLPNPIRVLINNREPDQRGTVVNVAGRLVDLLADPVRDRFYVLRQDTNQILVFNGNTQTQIATLRTANTPTQLAITFDRRYLMVGHDNAQIIRVFDLDTLEETQPIRMPGGYYPRSIAASGNAILVANRVAGPIHRIARVDFVSRTATALPTLGVFENDIHINTVLIGTPNGSAIMAAMADGRAMLYNSNTDTFTVARKDFTELSGSYAASSFDQFVIGNNLLNSSLVATRRFDAGAGRNSGFFFLDQGGFRTVAADSAAAGVIQRFDATNGQLGRSTRMAEAPVLPEVATSTTAPTTPTTPTAPTSPARQSWTQIFTRTIAPLANRSAIVNLTTSGFTVLPWAYDAAVAPPRIERVVNAADQSGAVAPGALVSIFGTDLSPINQASQQMPLPTALGESCLTVNGVPVPVVFVSQSQINGQIPFQVDGNVQMVLRTPGGVSDNFNLTILPNAPGIFRNGVAGNVVDLPAVFRNSNGLLVTPTNPVRRGDTISIYLTGLGRTSPAVEAGVPAPGDPLASVIVPPVVSIGNVEIPVEFAGLVPGSVGVYQVNARVTHIVPLGLEQVLTVRQGTGATSISVRVID
ncbi:MAG: hypothetical protein JNL98_09060 [Bryobacterales bacterium]|nr:hypothetical protein [Bryobacterales bacterium]